MCKALPLYNTFIMDHHSSFFQYIRETLSSTYTTEKFTLVFFP